MGDGGNLRGRFEGGKEAGKNEEWGDEGKRGKCPSTFVVNGKIGVGDSNYVVVADPIYYYYYYYYCCCCCCCCCVCVFRKCIVLSLTFSAVGWYYYYYYYYYDDYYTLLCMCVYRKHIVLSSNRQLGVTMLSAGVDGNCRGGHRHISVKFGVSARSACFIKSATRLLIYSEFAQLIWPKTFSSI